MSLPESAECRACHHVGSNNFYMIRNGEVVSATCEWCEEQARITDYRQTGRLTSRLITDEAMSEVTEKSIADYIEGKRRHGGYADWAWHLCSLRNVPPAQIPESNWSKYKRLMSKALDLAPSRYSGKELALSPWDPPLYGMGLEKTSDEAVNHVIKQAYYLGIYTHSGQPVAQPRVYPNARESRNRLHELVKGFEREVWFGGLQDFIAKESGRGHKAEGAGYVFLSYVMAGRCRVQFELPDESAHFVVQTDETSKESCMGIHGIGATEEQASQLVNLVVADWRSKKFKLKADDKVGLG